MVMHVTICPGVGLQFGSNHYIKVGDENDANIYQIIMVGLLMANYLDVWNQRQVHGFKNGKRAYGEAGFRKHSTIDHLATLQVLMEESCLERQRFTLAP